MVPKNKLFDINPELPTLDLEDFEPETVSEPGAADNIKGSTHYGLIGAGASGARIAKAFFDIGYKKVLAVNASQEDLKHLDLPANRKLFMDASTTFSQHQILHQARKIFGTDIDHILVCLGAGGSCGSENAAGLIETARQYARYAGLKKPEKKVGAVVALPTRSELKSKAENVSSLMNYLVAGQITPLILIDNNKIKRSRHRETVKSFWPGVNNAFAALFDSFNTLSAKSTPYTCFDPADYQSLLNCPGCMTMGTTEIKKLTDNLAISKAVTNNLKNTMFPNGYDLSTAKAAGCIVVGGKKLFSENRGLQDNINYAFDSLADITCNATIHRGIYEDNKKSLRVYTILAGMDTPQIF